MPRVIGAGLMTYAMGLPRNLMRAVTEAQARWLEAASSEGVDTIMVGADCIVRRDFRDELPAGDVAIAFMKGHKRWRLNNGFIYVPAEARERVAPLLRRVADGCGEVMCDDMVALERALLPMPDDYGVHERQGLQVNFVPLDKWNRYMRSVEDEASEAAVLHFMGDAFKGKPLFFAWANRHGFAC
jgi:hypothetical protein